MRQRHEPQDILPIMEQFLGQNDRASIIVAGSMVEHSLEALIKSRLRKPASKTEDNYLFTDTGILGRFFEKIWAAYFMRLIGPRTRRELDLIRLIRNEVAHNMNPVSFQDQIIANRCRELSLLSTTRGFMEANLRNKFLATACAIVVLFLIRSESDNPLVDDESPEPNLIEAMHQILHIPKQ